MVGLCHESIRLIIGVNSRELNETFLEMLTVPLWKIGSAVMAP